MTAVVLELDLVQQIAVLELSVKGVAPLAIATRLRLPVEDVDQAIAYAGGVSDLPTVRRHLGQLRKQPRLPAPPKPRPAPTGQELGEPDHPAVAVAVAFHGTDPKARPAFLAALGDRAELEALTVCLAAMLPPTARLSELSWQAVTLQVAVRSRNVEHIRDALDAHDPLGLCDIATNIAAALPGHLDAGDALAWCDPDN